MSEQRHYWFHAKRYGWGWGMPASWEGWVVLVVFLSFTIGGAFLFPPHRALTRYVILMGVLTALLLVICMVKGEPPKWRWGPDDNEASKR
jgi:uncharacterized membrane protein YhaH (DUF805 family)